MAPRGVGCLRAVRWWLEGKGEGARRAVLQASSQEAREDVLLPAALLLRPRRGMSVALMPAEGQAEPEPEPELEPEPEVS